MLRAMLICILGLALVGPGAGRVALAQDKPLTEVTLTLDFIVLGRHAPWYVALAKGYYKDAGLNVKIIPAQGTAQAIQALEANVAQFAFTDVPALVQARARRIDGQGRRGQLPEGALRDFLAQPWRQRHHCRAVEGPRGCEWCGQLHAQGHTGLHEGKGRRSLHGQVYER